MSTEYECDRCLCVQYVQDGPVALYCFEDGRSFFGPHGIGWCSHCELLTAVEQVERPDELERKFDLIRALPTYTPSQSLKNILDCR